MSKDLKTGDRVFHPEKGEGTVSGFTANRARMHIRFDSGESEVFRYPEDVESGKVRPL